MTPPVTNASLPLTVWDCQAFRHSGLRSPGAADLSASKTGSRRLETLMISSRLRHQICDTCQIFDQLALPGQSLASNDMPPEDDPQQLQQTLEHTIVTLTQVGGAHLSLCSFSLCLLRDLVACAGPCKSSGSACSHRKRTGRQQRSAQDFAGKAHQLASTTGSD